MRKIIHLLGIGATLCAGSAAGQTPPTSSSLNKSFVNAFINAMANGSERDIIRVAADNVQVGVVHRNPSTGVEATEFSGRGRQVLAEQVSFVKKRINSSDSYSCSYDAKFASCRSKIAQGKGATVVSIATGSRGVTFVRISYATFDEMYKAYVGK